MPSELLDLVNDLLDDAPAGDVMSQQGDWRPHFGGVFTDVRTIVPHFTQGWPSRAKAQAFVRRYTTRQYGEHQGTAVIPCLNCPPNNQASGTAGCRCKWGIGTQYFISNDGTIARLISNTHDEARVTFHAGYVNTWSIGVETGNLGTEAAPPGNSWVRVSQTPAVEDLPGRNLWLRDLRGNPREVVACWWTTASYNGPAREPVGAGRMLFSEAQYRTWSVLGRFLAEQFAVPRNLPLLPHAKRSANVTTSAQYRRIVLADPAYDAIVASLPAGWNMTTHEFENDPNALDQAYAALASGGQNEAWNGLFDMYRGLHGHGFSGSDSGSDHDCPGPLFDWHRFARELWDWWWYPFDIEDVPFPGTGQTTAVAVRGYREPDGTTPLVEHYFDVDHHAAPMVPDGRRNARLRDGIHGPTSSPATWQLDPESPVYALANGELVAARFAQPADVVSLSFVLVRHQIFHDTTGGGGADADRLDYDRPPSTIYSLYMHLGHPPGLDLAAVSTDNPDWLNRVHVRKRECDLGMTFYNHATHHGIPDAAWNQALPGLAARPTLADGWQIDQTALTTFLADLAAGRIAMAPFTTQSTPIQILLGDFLGHGGVVGEQGTVLEHGIRVEVFSPSFLVPSFVATGTGTAWDAVPSTFVGHPVQEYPSEWARTPAGVEADALEAQGVDVSLVTWWPEVARAMALDPRIAAGDRLPLGGQVFHYRPFDIMAWLNGVTWRSEWPKYRRVDGTGNPVPAPAQPRSRRV